MPGSAGVFASPGFKQILQPPSDAAAGMGAVAPLPLCSSPLILLAMAKHHYPGVFTRHGRYSHAMCALACGFNARQDLVLCLQGLQREQAERSIRLMLMPCIV